MRLAAATDGLRTTASSTAARLGIRTCRSIQGGEFRFGRFGISCDVRGGESGRASCYCVLELQLFQHWYGG